MVADMNTEQKTGKVRLRVETAPNLQPGLSIAEFEFPKVWLKWRLVRRCAVIMEGLKWQSATLLTEP